MVGDGIGFDLAIWLCALFEGLNELIRSESEPESEPEPESEANANSVLDSLLVADAAINVLESTRDILSIGLFIF